MLVKFTVGNFLSFKDKVAIDLNATSLTEYREENIFESEINKLSVLKSLVIYGANSSGKSNLFKAINFFRKFIQDSSKDSQTNEKIPVDIFRLSIECLNKPSFFEIEFIYDSSKYRYGFEVDKSVIHSEWLYFIKKNKEYKLFDRKFQQIDIAKKFDITSKDLIKITRENALFLSVCAQFNVQSAILVLKGLSNIRFVTGINDEITLDFTIDMLNDKKLGTIVKNYIKGANLGFKDLKAEKVSITEEMLSTSKLPKEIRKILLDNKEESTLISTKHIIYDEDKNPVSDTYFNLYQNESLGTRKYISLAGPIIDSLLNGRTLIIDEFDARLHPLICKAIIKLFNSSQFNHKGAQLIFASHNSTFISPSNKLFRRDQIIITERDSYGSTRMESLYEKKVRKDASFEKDYLSGKYEGVPIDLQISAQLDLFDN